MTGLASLALRILHASYAVFALILSYVQGFRIPAPRSLEYPRRQIPKHLALVLVTEDGKNSEEEETCISRIIADVVIWSKAVGIESLSVYNKQGKLHNYAETIREVLRESSQLEWAQQEADCHSDSDVDFPLTPPPSDHSISRPLSRNENRNSLNSIISMSLESHRSKEGNAGIKRRIKSQGNTFRLKLLSSDASKPLMAQIAKSFAMSTVDNEASTTSTIEIDTIDAAMQGFDLDAPDFMIIHDIRLSKSSSLELEGFPPWLVRLTEIHKIGQNNSKNKSSSMKTNGLALTEVDFRLALDEFASAEMRIGK